MEHFTFTFSLEETNIVLEGLGKLPLERSITLYSKVQNEGNRQAQEKQKATSDEDVAIDPLKHGLK